MCWVRSTVLMKITIANWRQTILCLVQHQAVHTGLADGLGNSNYCCFTLPQPFPRSYLAAGRNYEDYLAHFLLSFFSNCLCLDPKPVAPDPAPLCSIYGSLLHGCLFLGYQQQSIWQRCQHPSLPLSTVGDINSHQLVGFGPFWAGLFFTASKQDFQGFQERQTFAHIGKNKIIKQVVLNWPENIPAQPQTGFASLCCIDDKGKICRAICSLKVGSLASSELLEYTENWFFPKIADGEFLCHLYSSHARWLLLAWRRKSAKERTNKSVTKYGSVVLFQQHQHLAVSEATTIFRFIPVFLSSHCPYCWDHSQTRSKQSLPAETLRSFKVNQLNLSAL